MSFLASFLALGVVEFPKDPSTGLSLLPMHFIWKYLCKHPDTSFLVNACL
jgi:hypothetical protein